MVVRGTTPAACPSTVSRKLWSPAMTVTILPAWIRPTWIFWVATMMPPREETRRCTVTGPDGGGGLAAALRAPRSRYRSPGGTGQGMVRASSPSLVMTAIWVPSIRFRRPGYLAWIAEQPSEVARPECSYDGGVSASN